jgi:hypothetical protein
MHRANLYFTEGTKGSLCIATGYMNLNMIDRVVDYAYDN